MPSESKELGVCNPLIYEGLHTPTTNKQSIIGLQSSGNADFIKFVLTKNSDKKTLLDSLKRKNINISNSKSSIFFNIDSKANEKISLSVEEDAFFLISDSK